MEPSSPKKIQFAVPPLQGQLDPQAAEHVSVCMGVCMFQAEVDTVDPCGGWKVLLSDFLSGIFSVWEQKMQIDGEQVCVCVGQAEKGPNTQIQRETQLFAAAA